jgi:bacteriocin biosynthesis cyclodehydratase domain-containing protein
MNSVHFIALDDFGLAVSERFAMHHRIALAGLDDALKPASWPRSDCQVVAGQREHPALFEMIDEMAFALDRPWVSVLLEPRSLRVGPVITPKVSPCYQCFIRRQHQHGRRTATDAELGDILNADLSVAHSGFLPAHATLASRLVDRLLRASEPTAREMPHLFRVGFAELNISESHLLGVHGCARCAPQESPTSSWNSLASLLQ